jgi:hypothetical protein
MRREELDRFEGSGSNPLGTADSNSSLTDVTARGLYPVPFVVSAGRKFRIPADEWPRLVQQATSLSLRELACYYGVSYEAVRQTLRAAGLARTSAR